MSNDRTRSSSPTKKSRGPSGASSGPTQTGSGKKNAAGQRFAARQAAKQQAALEARHARNRRYGFISIVVVVVVVAALVIVKVSGGGGGSSSATGDIPSPPRGTPIAPATLAKLASVPLSTLAAAPTDGILTQPQAISGSPLSTNSKPELLFVGAEFCPYCAAERWAMYVALSKFGTFSPEPGRIHSATLDGNVPTLTFYGTNYTSPYFTFTPIETYTNHSTADGSYVPLQSLTNEQNQLWQSIAGGHWPFLDFDGKSALVGAQYSYAPMENLSFPTVAAQVGNNSTVIGANINAGAHQLIQTICLDLSAHQPANVCSDSGGA
jgi:Domain of unknown function (DUF929)